MSDGLRVEFKVAVGKRRAKPKSPDRAELQRQDRAARRARNLALAYWIDRLVRSGEVPDLAAVARMCGVSRARVTTIAAMLGINMAEQHTILRHRVASSNSMREECRVADLEGNR